MALIAPLPIGHPDLPRITSEHPCKWCGQRFTMRARMYQIRSRHYCNRDCVRQASRARTESRMRRCADCGINKVLSNYSRKGDAREHSIAYPYCKHCEAANKKHKHYYGEVAVAPHTCKICGDIIVKRRSKSALQSFVVCSAKCAGKNRRRESVECVLCQKALPWESFEQLKNGALNKRCKKCCKEATPERGFIGLRPSYTRLLVDIRNHAKHHSKDFELSTRDARKLWSQPCLLCGGKVSKFVHRQRGQRVDKTTIQAMCRACALLDKVFPLGKEGLIEQARKIAAHHKG